jgi:hypothetical protein
LAVIQALACFAISIFVNLALLQNPELYGLCPDGDGSTPSPQIGLTASAQEQDCVALDGLTDSRTAFTDKSACSNGPEPPVDVGLRSEGQADAAEACTDELQEQGSDPSANQKLEGLTVRESIRRPIFWLIVLSIFFIDVLWGGFNLHFVSVLEDQGLGRTSGASTFLATSIAAALSSLLCGPFFDRLPVGMKVRSHTASLCCHLLFFGLVNSVAASWYCRCHWMWGAHIGLLPLLHPSSSCCTCDDLFQASIYLLTSPRQAWLIGFFYGVLDSFSFIGVGVAMSDSFGRAHLAKLMSITRSVAALHNAVLCRINC